MGPLRRGLTLTALCATPTGVFADVCDKLRPMWTPGTPAGALDELIALLATPPSLILLLASALCLRFSNQWATLIVVVLWSFWVSYVAMSSPDAVRLQAIKEGCIGPPTLFIALVAAICGGMILYTTRRSTRPS